MVFSSIICGLLWGFSGTSSHMSEWMRLPGCLSKCTIDWWMDCDFLRQNLVDRCPSSTQRRDLLPAQHMVMSTQPQSTPLTWHAGLFCFLFSSSTCFWQSELLSAEEQQLCDKGPSTQARDPPNVESGRSLLLCGWKVRPQFSMTLPAFFFSHLCCVHPSGFFPHIYL